MQTWCFQYIRVKDNVGQFLCLLNFHVLYPLKISYFLLRSHLYLSGFSKKEFNMDLWIIKKSSLAETEQLIIGIGRKKIIEQFSFCKII